MSREANTVQFRYDSQFDPALTSGAIASDRVVYFEVGDRALRPRSAYWTLHTAGNDENETIDFTWDYSTNGSDFTTIAASAANRDVGGSTLTAGVTALVPNAITLTDAQKRGRIPAGAIIRLTVDVEGSTPVPEAMCTLNCIPI